MLRIILLNQCDNKGEMKMNDNILYPKNINDLKIKIKYYIEQ